MEFDENHHSLNMNRDLDWKISVEEYLLCDKGLRVLFTREVNK